MKACLELPSPAKINLFLDVLSRRDDGYHDVVTVFEKIDLCDSISFSDLNTGTGVHQEGIEITSNAPELPCDGSNLAYRACLSLKKRYGISKGVKIHIEKRIPIAAGLGGGSSNAAVVLRGLNRLWGLRLRDKELSDVGKGIGADVPFFIFNHSFAVGTGVGDEISPIKSDLEMWHVIISPPHRVLTKEVYDGLSLGLTASRPDVKILVRAVEENNVRTIEKSIYNALEPVVKDKVADISAAKEMVNGWGFSAAGVTGSGPAIFVLTFGRKEAFELRGRLRDSFVSGMSGKGWKFFVAKTATNERKE